MTIRTRLLLYLRDGVFAALLAFVFLLVGGAGYLLRDSDTGWHIRTGEWILAHRAAPRQDLFSFSKPGGEWFAWEWLSDVVLAMVHRYAGLTGVAFLAALTIALMFTRLYGFLRERGVSVPLATALTALATYASSIHWLARPHVFGWAMALAFFRTLEQTPVERKSIYRLALLAALWANLHGSFVLALVLVALYGLGELARAVLAAGETAAETRAASLGRAGRYGLLWLACAGATFLNPYFYQLHLHILAYLRDPYIPEHITEFFSASFHFGPAKAFEVLLLLGLATFWWCLRRAWYAQAFLVLATGHFALVSARYIPLYAVFAAPIIASALTGALAALRETSLPPWLNRLQRAACGVSTRLQSVEAAARVPAVPLLLVLLIAAPAWARSSRVTGFDPKSFPVGAAGYLEKEGFTGPVFSTDQWSSYLIYRSHPRIQVFVDGRSDYYGSKMVELYLNILNVHHTWQESLDRYGVNTAVLPADAALSSAMKESGRWRVAYDDGVAIVFHRAAPAAQ